MDRFKLTHENEKKLNSALNNHQTKMQLKSPNSSTNYKIQRVVTYFDGDKRFKFIHSEFDSISDVKAFFYDYCEENLFFGDIYSFISNCFKISAENGGRLQFNNKVLNVVGNHSFSGVGLDELENIEVRYAGNNCLLTELIEHEI